MSRSHLAEEPEVHPANPKSSARGGARRFPAGVRALLSPVAGRDQVIELLSNGELRGLAEQGEVVTFRAGRVQQTAVRGGLRVDDRWRSALRPIRRIGSYREAPNRIGMYVVEQDGHRLLLEAESDLELSHLRDRQFTAGVTWMLTQPFVLRWAWRVPDILGVDSGGCFAADVKPESLRTEFTEAMFDLTRATLEVRARVPSLRGDLREAAVIAGLLAGRRDPRRVLRTARELGLPHVAADIAETWMQVSTSPNTRDDIRTVKRPRFDAAPV